MHKPPLLLFDFDGVVVDSFDIFYKEFSGAIHELGFTRLQTRDDFLNLFEGNVFVQLVKAGFPVWRLKKLAERFGPRIAEANARVQPYPGMPELLTELAARHTTFIVSSNATQAVESFLSRHNVTGIVDVLGADKERSKVKKIKQVKRQYKDHAAWYLGDTKGDMIEGRHAGATTVAIAWGWHDEARLRSGNPDHLVRTQDELRALLM